MSTHSLPPIPTSIASSISWPAIPSPQAASMLAMQYQLEVSQWWSPEVLLQRQLEQVSRLFYHAHRSIPFYKERLNKAGYRPGEDVSLDMYRGIPLLRRAEIQEMGEALVSKSPPKDHGRLIEHTTSGSTGRPIRAWWTELTQFFWHAMTLRDHLWHEHDFSGKLAVIRSKIRAGASQGWGPSTDVAFKTGKAVGLDIKTDIKSQLHWLRDQAPTYLLSHPSNIHALAKLSLAEGIAIPSLKEVRTFGETVTPELRQACRNAWGAGVVDAYSSEEIGYMAMQCPKHEHYHILSEAVLLEVLNEDDKPCEPGEIGRVVVTTLHNFAMPLIRYEILDFAEVGEPCSCGRGLPVLKRIVGRQRNLVTLPDGSSHWPSFPTSMWMDIGPIRQIQLVQKQLDHIEARLVCQQSLTTQQEHQLIDVLQDRLGYPFHITLAYLDEIPRKANAKFEDFISELAAPLGPACE